MKKKYFALLGFALAIQIASAQNTWLQKTSFGGSGRMGAVAFSVGTKGYLGTGGDFQSTYYKDLWEYDPVMDSWTQKADLPSVTRYRAIGFATDSKGYIGTGYNNTANKNLWEYDPSLNSWTQKANVGSFGRFGSVCFVIGDKAYAGTGVGSNYLKDFWEYNMVTDVWTQKADFGGNEKIYATGFSIDDKGYLGTGGEISNIGIGTSDFWEYDTTANAWTQKSDVPGSGRSEAIGFSISGFGFIGCGTSNWGIGALSDFWMYDPSTDTWTSAADYPDGPVEEATAFVIGCKAYVGTGFVDDNSITAKTSLWEYTPANGCSLPPQALLQVSDSSFCALTCIDFTDQSTNDPTSWQWSFPGGVPSSSTDENPTAICYNTAGSYDVTLIATNSIGSDTIVLTDFIQVSSLPTVTITQSNDTLYSSSGNSYQWYNGGNEIAGATNEFYVPSAEDYFSVVITDSTGCTAADTIFFSLAPQTNFEASDTSVCQKFCMDFFDQSNNNPTSWLWSFQGGSPFSSTEENPTEICYNTPGTFDVTLVTSNAYGSDTLTLTAFITTYPTPPFPTITQSGDTLTSSFSQSYQWQLNSADVPGATNQSYIVMSTGFYTVIITDENGCVSSSTLFVEFSGIENLFPDLNFSVYPNPSNGNLTIQLMNGKLIGLLFIEIENNLGQQVYHSEEVLNSTHWMKEIDFSSSANGVYFLELKMNDVYLTRKIVLQK